MIGPVGARLRHRRLAEPAGIQPGTRGRSGHSVGLAATGVALVLSAAFFLSRPAPASHVENGVFANDCCGTLELRDGLILLNGKQAVRYLAGRDSRGPYILPRTYVGAFEDIGFEVDGTRPATRLRIDRLPEPRRILLYGGAKPFAFTSKALAGSR